MKETVIIRSAVAKDTAIMLEIYAPYILESAVSFEMELPTIEEFQARVDHYQATLPWLVCEIGNTLAGYAYATDHRQRKAYSITKELSVYVHSNFRQQGIATGLYTALMEILKAQGVSNVLAGITLPNPVSVGFHESVGFKPVGVYHKVGYKFGKFHDTGWWEMLLNGHNNHPLDLIPVHKIEDTDTWDKAIARGITKIKS